MAALVNYTCKSFIKLTPVFKVVSSRRCFAFSVLVDIRYVFFYFLGCASLKDITPSLVMKHPPSHL